MLYIGILGSSSIFFLKAVSPELCHDDEEEEEKYAYMRHGYVPGCHMFFVCI